MTENSRVEQDWQEVVDAWNIFLKAQEKLFQSAKNLLRDPQHLEFIRAKINSREKYVALEIAKQLPDEEKIALLPELLVCASSQNNDYTRARQIITFLPKSKVLPILEQVAEPLLMEGTEEEYMRLLELYSMIDDQLTQRLAKRAYEHPDKYIHEAGEFFLDGEST